MFASPEVETFWTAIEDALGRLVALTEGLDADQLNWRPEAAEPTNSLYVLAWHALGSTEGALLFLLCGEEGSRDREAEFRAGEPTAAAIEQRWAGLQPRLAAALARVEPSTLEGAFEHPRRGPESGRLVLVRSALHIAEHLGQAELTRDLLPVGD